MIWSGSRDHAIVSLDGSHLKITDMSKIGVWVNGVRVEPGSSRNLTDGDIVTVRDARIAFKLQSFMGYDDSMEPTQAGLVEMIVTSLVASMANKNLANPIVVCGQTAKLVDSTLWPVDLGLVPVRGRSGQECVYGFGKKTGS